MRILMLGNSFTFFHDMPKMLAAILPAEVVAHVRGGASLADQINPGDALCGECLRLLREEKWDYVVLQDQSRGPVCRRESFDQAADALCAMIREQGAQPLFYATWAYREGSQRLQDTGMSYAEMARGLYTAYHAAAERNGALIADVGEAFTAMRSIENVYEDDDFHPNAVGSLLAAQTIARVIEWAQRG